jgi:protein phosphatase
MYKIGYKTHVGIKRKKEGNQDSIGVVHPGIFKKEPILVILADGMGGYYGGSIASKQVVRSIGEHFKSIQSIEDPAEVLRQGISIAHTAIVSKGLSTPEYNSMGSTVVTALLYETEIFLANVGDSRAYITNSQGLSQVSLDHSLVAEQLRQGILTAEQAQTHPQRNILTESLSAQRKDAQIFSTHFSVSPGDILLVCSDGLWGAVSHDLILDVVINYPPPMAAEVLVDLANQYGGPDNISVIVAQKT